MQRPNGNLMKNSSDAKGRHRLHLVEEKSGGELSSSSTPPPSRSHFQGWPLQGGTIANQVKVGAFSKMKTLKFCPFFSRGFLPLGFRCVVRILETKIYFQEKSHFQNFLYLIFL